jgi:hypothetical protein
VHGRPADGCEPFDADASKHKVFSPLVAPRTEEEYRLAGGRVEAREVRALGEIAALAGQGELVNVVAAAMLPRDDMLDVVRQVAVLLAEQAILTRVVRPSTDKVPRGGIHLLGAVGIQLSSRLEL